MPTEDEGVTAELVRLESVSPPFCEARGIRNEFQPVEPGRANVLASVPGREEARLLFEAHMDTVPALDWTRDPFGGEREGSWLYGRGPCDTKASLAAMPRPWPRLGTIGRGPLSRSLRPWTRSTGMLWRGLLPAPAFDTRRPSSASRGTSSWWWPTGARSGGGWRRADGPSTPPSPIWGSMPLPGWLG